MATQPGVAKSGSFAEQFGWVPTSANLAVSLARAQAQAGAQSHRFVTLEHLLFALSDDADAVLVLRSCNVDADRLRQDMASYLGQLQDRVAPHETAPQAAHDDLLKILRTAAEAARQVQRSQIDGAIVLAALVGEGRSPAAEFLKSYGLTFEAAIRSLQTRGNEPETADQSDEVRAEETSQNAAVAAPSKPAAAAKKIASPQKRPPAAEPVASSPAIPPQPQTGTTPAKLKLPAPKPATQVPLVAPMPETRDEQAAVLQDGADEHHGSAGAPTPVRQAPTKPAVPDTAPGSSETLVAPPPAPPPAEPNKPAPVPTQHPAAGTVRDRGAPPSQPPTHPAPAHPLSAPTQARRRQAPQPATDMRTEALANPPWPETAAPPVPQPPVPRPGLDPRAGGIAGPPFPSPDAIASPSPPAPRTREAFAPGSATAAAVDSGKLVENIPRRMRVAIPCKVEVRVARNGQDMQADAMAGIVHQHALSVTKAMAVRLRAPDGGFHIEPGSPETQWITFDSGLHSAEFAAWHWRVTPQRRGRMRLRLVVSSRTIAADGLTAESTLPDRIVDIRVRANYGLLARRWGIWLAAMICGGILGRFGEGAFDITTKLLQRLVSGQ